MFLLSFQPRSHLSYLQKQTDLDSVVLVADFVSRPNDQPCYHRLACSLPFDTTPCYILGDMFDANDEFSTTWDHSSAMVVRAMYDLGVDLFPTSDQLEAALSNMFKHCNAIPEAFDVLLGVGAAQVDPKLLFTEVLEYLRGLLEPLTNGTSGDRMEHVLPIEEQCRSLLSVLLRRSEEFGLDAFLSQGEQFNVCAAQFSIDN